MSLFSIGKFLLPFLGLGTFSVTSLALSIPETFTERTFQLSNCVMSSWGSNTASVFKCLQEKDGSFWAFYLPSSWRSWFHGTTGRNNSRTGANVLGNTTLTIENGHKEIKITSTTNNGTPKTLQVVRLENDNGKVRAYAPQTISQPQSTSIKSSIMSNLDHIELEVKNK